MNKIEMFREYPVRTRLLGPDTLSILNQMADELEENRDFKRAEAVRDALALLDDEHLAAVRASTDRAVEAGLL